MFIVHRQSREGDFWLNFKQAFALALGMGDKPLLGHLPRPWAHLSREGILPNERKKGRRGWGQQGQGRRRHLPSYGVLAPRTLSLPGPLPLALRLDSALH